MLLLSRDYQGKGVNPHIDPPTKVIPGELLARCVDVIVKDLFTCMSLRFVSFQRKGKPSTLWRCFLRYFDYKLSVCFSTFGNLDRSLNKRRMSPSQTITIE